MRFSLRLWLVLFYFVFDHAVWHCFCKTFLNWIFCQWTNLSLKKWKNVTDLAFLPDPIVSKRTCPSICTLFAAKMPEQTPIVLSLLFYFFNLIIICAILVRTLRPSLSIRLRGPRGLASLAMKKTNDLAHLFFGWRVFQSGIFLLYL